MKKLNLILLLIVVLHTHSIVYAQCTVTITGVDNNNVAGTVLNCTNATITLTANPGTGSVDPVSYSWGALNGQTLDASLPGVYTVEMRDNAGCISSSSIIITEDLTQPVISLYAFPGTEICEGQVCTLVGLGANSFSWSSDGFAQDSVGNPFPVYPTAIALPTVYTVIGIGANGCESSPEQISITVIPATGVDIITSGNVFCVGEDASADRLTATPSGREPFTYQWYINTVNNFATAAVLSGETGATCIPLTNTAGTFYYFCRVSGRCDDAVNVTIDAITVKPLPQIITQPVTTAQVICQNGNTTPVYVGATGTDLVYSWRETTFPNSPIGTNSPYFYPDSSIIGGPLFYYCIVYSTACATGAVASNTAGPVYIKEPTVISNGPSIRDTAYCFNTPTAALTVRAQGDGQLQYQWYSNTTAGYAGASEVTGATDSFYAPPSDIIGTHYYYCIVTGGCGTGEASNISGFVKIAAPVAIVAQPSLTSQAACLGNPVIPVSVEASGTARYQWYKNSSPTVIGGQLITGATANSFLPPTDIAGTFYYYCIVSGDCDNIISNVSGAVTVYEPPALIIQPPGVDIDYCLGDVSSPLTVDATGTALTFQWYSNTERSYTNSSLINGAVNSSFYPSTAAAASLYYYCVVSGTCTPSVTSALSGKVVIKTPPVINNQSMQAQTVCLSSRADPLSVAATGTGLQYQWYKNVFPSYTGSFLLTDSVRSVLFPSTSVVGIGYYYCIVNGACAPPDTSIISEPVEVKPLPTATIAGSKTVCQNSEQPVIIFDGSGGAAPYIFVYNVNGAASDTTASVRSDSGFVNVSTNIVTTYNYNLLSVKDSYGCTQAQGDTAKITVVNKPVLSRFSITSVCDSAVFADTVFSSDTRTNFSWVRYVVPELRNAAKRDTGSNGTAVIYDTLNNITAAPVLVPYYFTLSTGQGCVTEDSLFITVNPTPVTGLISDLTYCNGEIDFDGITFNSNTPNVLFDWKSDKTVGFGIGPSPNITGFIASNPNTAPLTATVAVGIAMADNPQCKGLPDTFSITVNPSAPRPDFTWLDINNNNVCSAAGNLNFNVSVPVSGISYTWQTIPANTPGVSIQDVNSANTVISFSQTGGDSVKVIATNNIGGCRDSVTQAINVVSGGSITEQEILLKQPGNILIYPDNSMDPVTGYQWGYDSLITPAPDYSFSAPHPVQGQVYQFFLPDSNKFFSGNQLDTVTYKFWVLLQKGGCYTKVYYNGPYARRPLPVMPPQRDVVQLLILPNPNSGSFNINVKGNIYGNISAMVYNALGQVVLKKQFVKTLPDIRETINRNDLPQGLYYIVINSSDLKKAAARFIIQH